MRPTARRAAGPGRLAAPFAATAVIVLGAIGCGVYDRPVSDTPRTYSLPVSSVRPGEEALGGRVLALGPFRVTPLGWTPRRLAVAGTHAELLPRGVYTRLRLALEDADPAEHALDVSTWRLLVAGGPAAGYAPDLDAERISRQPLQVDLGAHDRLEFDVWWDIAVSARPTEVVLVGEHGAPVVRYALPGSGSASASPAQRAGSSAAAGQG